MNTNKHIGFDLWGTIIKSNPEFTERKGDLYRKFFPHTSVKVCNEVMTSVKNDLNKIIEDSGWMPKKEIIETLIATRLDQSVENVKKFLDDYQRLAIIYSPILISDKTKELLGELSKTFRLGIVSNTMFIDGDTLTEILKQHEIFGFFTKIYYSDKLGKSKPNDVANLTTFDYFIGDNLKTDKVFIEKNNTKTGKFIQINSNDKTLQDAFNIITENR